VSPSAAPATEGIGAPITDTSIGPIGPIKWVKYISVRAHSVATRTTRRAMPTIKIMTDVSNAFPVVNHRSLISGHYLREATGTDERKRGRHYENGFVHSNPLGRTSTGALRDYIIAFEMQLATMPSQEQPPRPSLAGSQARRDRESLPAEGPSPTASS
jgi:hypothetical protein